MQKFFFFLEFFHLIFKVNTSLKDYGEKQQMNSKILKSAQEKQKKGQKLDLFEAQAFFKAQAAPPKPEYKPSGENRNFHAESKDDEIERLHKSIESLERKIEMDSLSPDQEKKNLESIEKMQKRLDQISGSK